MDPSRLEIRAPAKINLGLHIVGKRADGYHDLETIFLMIDLCDELELQTTKRGISFTCDDPTAPDDASNLVHRAAHLLAEEAGLSRGVRITLKKRVPAAAGLGGGSSDAASALLGLNYLWSLHWPRTRLAELASRLGADVPFFLGAPCAIGTGSGIHLKPLPVNRKWPVLLINPGFPVSTAWAFGQVKMPLTSARSDITLSALHLVEGSLEKLQASARNDLQGIVREAHPEVGQIEDAVRRCGAPLVTMSGSGPTVVAWFATPEAAQEAAVRLNGRWRVFLQSTILELAEIYPSAVLDVAA